MCILSGPKWRKVRSELQYINHFKPLICGLIHNTIKELSMELGLRNFLTLRKTSRRHCDSVVCGFQGCHAIFSGYVTGDYLLTLRGCVMVATVVAWAHLCSAFLPFPHRNCLSIVSTSAAPPLHFQHMHFFISGANSKPFGMVQTRWLSIFSKHPFRQVAFTLFILFFKIILVEKWCGQELNQFCPPNSSNDLRLLFCLYPSSIYVSPLHLQLPGWEPGGQTE